MRGAGLRNWLERGSASMARIERLSVSRTTASSSVVSFNACRAARSIGRRCLASGRRRPVAARGGRIPAARGPWRPARGADRVSE